MLTILYPYCAIPTYYCARSSRWWCRHPCSPRWLGLRLGPYPYPYPYPYP
jgi:hypothetical protein